MTTGKKKLTGEGIVGLGCFFGGFYLSKILIQLLAWWSAPMVYFGVEKALSENITTTYYRFARGAKYIIFSTGQNIQLSEFPTWFHITTTCMFFVLGLLFSALLLRLIQIVVYKFSGKRVLMAWLPKSSPSNNKKYISLKKSEAEK